MGLFVDENARFKIHFFYKDIISKEGEDIGAEILYNFDNFESLEEVYNYIDKNNINIDKTHINYFEGYFKPASHKTMSTIREESSVINHRNEKGMLWMRIYRPKVVASLCTKWNAKLQNSNEIATINEKNADALHEHILIEIINRWRNMIGNNRGKNGNSNDIQN
jgi:hypothetical protein